MKICPVCETENKPQATHCEVCGERLSPPAPGEVISPEESVAAQLASAPPPATPTPATPPPATPPTGGFFTHDEPGAPAATPAAAPSEPAPAARADAARQKDADLEAAFAALEAAAAEEDAAAAPAPPTPAPTPVTPAPVAPPVAAAPPARPAAPARPAPQIISSGIPDARLVIYQNKQPTHTHPVVNDETLIGRYDAISGSFPDLDLTEFDANARISRKHAYIYRQNREYYLYPVSNGGTQLGGEIVEMGQRKKLSDGDVIILAMSLAMKFHIDG